MTRSIKCPNCGGKMIKVVDDNFACDCYCWMGCPQCGVRGPCGIAPTVKGAVRISMKLCREWIKRMGTDKCQTETVRDVIIEWLERNKEIYMDRSLDSSKYKENIENMMSKLTFLKEK